MKEQQSRRFEMGRTLGLSRRSMLRGTASAVLGAGLLDPKWVHAIEGDDDDESKGDPNPIPGGVKPVAPFGIFVHHNPLNAKNGLAINDPS